MMYDVVVVGAGLAGSSTARFAAERGLRVVILDRKREPGLPLQCGEFLPSTEELASMLPRVRELRRACDIPQSLVSTRVDKIRLLTPRGKRYEFPFKGFSVDRPSLDRYLAQAAVRAGAELRTGFKALSVHGTRVRSGDGETIEGRVVVGADGHSSLVARSVGLPVNRSNVPCALALVEGDYEPVMEMHFGSLAPGGFAWVIPKAGGANVGLGVGRGKGASAVGLLRGFMKDRGLGEPLYNGAGLVPMSGPLSITVKDNVLLVGDAAGQVMATNGGGVPMAMICGMLAGKAIAAHLNDGLPLLNYETDWRSAVGRELENARRTKRLADMFMGGDMRLELAMRLLGKRGMERAVKCRRVPF